MASRGWTLARIAEVIGSGKDALKEIDEKVTLHVCVGHGCPRDLALVVKRVLSAERSGGTVEVCALDTAPIAGAESPDAALVLVGDDDPSEVVSRYARSGVPVALIVEGALDVPGIDLPEQALSLVGVIASSSADDLPDKLASWLAGSVDKGIALAANFPFCRAAVVDELVRRCAVENAAVGAISLIPGSDLPIMCANQAMLALDIAAAYGRGLEPARAAELAGVLGAGFVWRSLARSLVGLVPGLGFALKAGVGYGGTIALGSALRLRFEAELLSEEGFPDEVVSAGPAGRSLPKRNEPEGDEGYVVISGEGA